MAVVAIIQPGKIGDIIICLPIAKYYHDRGYEVLWPVMPNIFYMLWPAVHYVKFVPVMAINREMAIVAARRYCPDIHLVDLYFGFPDAPELTAKWKASGLSFDQYKYQLAEVPFAEKNKLVIRRELDRELAFYNKLNQPVDFKLVHQEASDGTRDILQSPLLQNSTLLTIKPATQSIFDWLTVMEKADELHFIDSCFVNLASQLDIGTVCYRYERPDYIEDMYYPVLNPKWVTIK